MGIVRHPARRGEIVASAATALSTGTRDATTYGITSDGGADDVILLEATTALAGLLGAAKWDEIVANTAKSTNVSTALSLGTIDGNTVGITSDGGADDVILPAATVAAAGMLTTAKWAEIVANTAKVTNVSTALSVGTVGTDTVAITSDGGADDVTLPAATVSAAGMLTTAKWAEIVANTAKVTNATHTGDVTGDTALTIAAGAVDVAMLANGTDGELITWDAAGAPAVVAVGTATHVLTSNGAGAAPTFQAAAGGGLTPYPGLFRGSTNVNITTTEATMDLTTESFDPDTNYSLATDIITVTTAGYYIISYNVGVNVDGGGGSTTDTIVARITKNGTTTEIVGSESRAYIDEGGVYRPDTAVTTTFITALAAADTIRIRCVSANGTDVSQIGAETYLSIYRIRANP